MSDGKQTAYVQAIARFDPNLARADARERIFGPGRMSLETVGQRAIVLKLDQRTSGQSNYRIFKIYSITPDQRLEIRYKRTARFQTLQSAHLAELQYYARVANEFNTRARSMTSLKLLGVDVARVQKHAGLVVIEESFAFGESLSKNINEIMRIEEDPDLIQKLSREAALFGFVLLRIHALGFAHGDLKVDNVKITSTVATTVCGFTHALKLPETARAHTLRMYDLSVALNNLQRGLELRNIRQTEVVNSMLSSALRAYLQLSAEDDFVAAIDGALRAAGSEGTLLASEGGSAQDAVDAVLQFAFNWRSEYEADLRAAIEA